MAWGSRDVWGSGFMAQFEASFSGTYCSNPEISRPRHTSESGEFRAEPLPEIISRDEVDPDTAHERVRRIPGRAANRNHQQG